MGALHTGIIGVRPRQGEQALRRHEARGSPVGRGGLMLPGLATMNMDCWCIWWRVS